MPAEKIISASDAAAQDGKAGFYMVFRQRP